MSTNGSKPASSGEVLETNAPKSSSASTVIITQLGQPLTSPPVKDSESQPSTTTGTASEGNQKSPWRRLASFFSRKKTNASNTPASDPVNILDSAWQLSIDYDYNAGLSVERHRKLRQSVIVLGVVATLLAILSNGQNQQAAGILRLLLILVPITSSVVLAMANRFQEGERWLALKTGAENVMRVIYISRTILSPTKNMTEMERQQAENRRDQWLEERLAEIRRETLQQVNGNLALKTYPWRSRWDVDEPGALQPLNADQYIDERLTYGIDEYTQKIDRAQAGRVRLQVTILTLGGIGSLIAALSNMPQFTKFGLSIWVALSTAFAVAVSSWLELRELDWRAQRGISPEEKEKPNGSTSEKTGSRSSIDDPLEATVGIYSHIINELTIARDHWRSLGKESDNTEFYELVLLVERILWGRDFPLDTQIQESLNQFPSSPDTAPEDIKQPAPASPPGKQVTAGIPAQVDAQPATRSRNAHGASDTDRGETGRPDLSGRTAQGNRVQLKPRRVVVLMPAGRKITSSGQRIDFDHIYNRLIKPALDKDGFTFSRWSKTKVVDSVQELLLADIVIADIGVDDPDVFYNLALRHAYRKQGIIHIREAKLKSSFRTFNVRTADYHCNKYGRIDSSKEANDRDMLLDLVRNISDSHADDNPVFHLLPGMKEPELRYLQAPSAIDFWSKDNQRRERVAIAQKQRRIGDILLLTEEIDNPMVKEEAFREAGQALKDMSRHDLALQWYRQALELNPRSLFFRREEAFCLNRLKKPQEAVLKLESLLEENPGDNEAIAYLGRIYKDIWYSSWNKEEYPDLAPSERRQKAFDTSHWLLKSFETYMRGYRHDLNTPHPGTNAFTLGMAYVHLVKLSEVKEEADPYLNNIAKDVLPELKGALTLALENRLRNGKGDYPTLAALAELCAMTSNSAEEVRQAYRRALMGAKRTPIRMRGSLRQLRMLKELELPDLCLDPGIEELEAELRLMPLSKGTPTTIEDKSVSQVDRKVFLFNGDTGSVSAPRPDKWVSGEDGFESKISQKIKGGFDRPAVQKDDRVLVIATGMGSGSEIIFLEYCVDHGFSVQVYLPGTKEEYISRYVWPGSDWEDRFEKLCNHLLVDDYYQAKSIGVPTEDDSEFKRNTRWARYYAQVYAKDYTNIIVENRENGCPEINFGTIKKRIVDNEDQTPGDDGGT